MVQSLFAGIDSSVEIALGVLLEECVRSVETAIMTGINQIADGAPFRYMLVPNNGQCINMAFREAF